MRREVETKIGFVRASVDPKLFLKTIVGVRTTTVDQRIRLRLDGHRWCAACAIAVTDATDIYDRIAIGYASTIRTAETIAPTDTALVYDRIAIGYATAIGAAGVVALAYATLVENR